MSTLGSKFNRLVPEVIIVEQMIEDRGGERAREDSRQRENTTDRGRQV
jgi:hypothetical protein